MQGLRRVPVSSEAAVALPEGMPRCPPQAFFVDLPLGLPAYRAYVEGFRRPLRFRQFERPWAIHWWESRGGYGGARNLARLWLSPDQDVALDRIILCEYCGAGQGQPCWARSVSHGQLTKTKPAAYIHAKRTKALNRLLDNIKFPDDLWPDWIWWAGGAVGEDPHALFRILSVLLGEPAATTYIENWAPAHWRPKA